MIRNRDVFHRLERIEEKIGEFTDIFRNLDLLESRIRQSLSDVSFESKMTILNARMKEIVDNTENNIKKGHMNNFGQTAFNHTCATLEYHLKCILVEYTQEQIGSVLAEIIAEIIKEQVNPQLAFEEFSDRILYLMDINQVKRGQIP